MFRKRGRAFVSSSLVHNQGRSVPMISRPFWRYSDPYSSPYFVPSQEPAFGPVSDLRMSYRTHPHLPTIFAFPVSLRSYSPLAPPIRQPYRPISTLSLTRSLRAFPTLFNLDFRYPDFRLSVATRDFLFRTDRFPRSLPLAPFPFPRREFPMSIPPS